MAATVAAAATGACAALMFGAGTASAFTVQPFEGGIRFEVNHAEAVALSQVRIVGPLLNPLYPHLEYTTGLPTGDTAQISIDHAAAYGNASAGMAVYGPLHAPDLVRFYRYG